MPCCFVFFGFGFCWYHSQISVWVWGFLRKLCRIPTKSLPHTPLFLPFICSTVSTPLSAATVFSGASSSPRPWNPQLKHNDHISFIFESFKSRQRANLLQDAQYTTVRQMTAEFYHKCERELTCWDKRRIDQRIQADEWVWLRWEISCSKNMSSKYFPRINVIYAIIWNSPLNYIKQVTTLGCNLSLISVKHLWVDMSGVRWLGDALQTGSHPQSRLRVVAERVWLHHTRQSFETLWKKQLLEIRAISRWSAHLQLEHPAVQHTLVGCRVTVGLQHVNGVRHPVL